MGRSEQTVPDFSSAAQIDSELVGNLEDAVTERVPFLRLAETGASTIRFRRRSGSHDLLVEDRIRSSLAQDDIDGLNRDHRTIRQGGCVHRAQIENHRTNVLEQDGHLTRLVFSVQLDLELELVLKT